MELRKAVSKDLPEVLSLFKQVTQDMLDHGIQQWDDIYPNKEILKSDIESGSMYLSMRVNQIAAVFVLNRECDPEYKDGSWRYPDSSFAVVHRLCVNPAFQHQGIGTRAMLAAESIVRDRKIESVAILSVRGKY